MSGRPYFPKVNLSPLLKSGPLAAPSRPPDAFLTLVRPTHILCCKRGSYPDTFSCAPHLEGPHAAEARVHSIKTSRSPSQAPIPKSSLNSSLEPPEPRTHTSLRGLQPHLFPAPAPGGPRNGIHYPRPHFPAAPHHQLGLVASESGQPQMGTNGPAPLPPDPHAQPPLTFLCPHP